MHCRCNPYDHFSISHYLPQTTLRVYNETDQVQQVVFYGTDALREVQPPTPSGIIRPGQSVDFVFLPQSMRRAVSILINPYNIIGSLRGSCYLRNTDSFVQMTIEDIINCDLDR